MDGNLRECGREHVSTASVFSEAQMQRLCQFRPVWAEKGLRAAEGMAEIVHQVRNTAAAHQAVDNDAGLLRPAGPVVFDDVRFVVEPE